MSIRIKLDKKVSASDTTPPVFTLNLGVTEVEGITPNIFVVQYTPGSKYTGPESYTFWNVAYADELSSIPDQPTNKRKECKIRKACVEYKCSSMDLLTDFITTVVSDVQRLIKSVRNSESAVLHSQISVTDETAVELPCEDSTATIADLTDKAGDTTISLSFTGE